MLANSFCFNQWTQLPLGNVGSTGGSHCHIRWGVNPHDVEGRWQSQGEEEREQILRHERTS